MSQNFNERPKEPPLPVYWHRLHSVGRRVTFGHDFRMTPRGAWYYEQSKARYLRRQDVYPPDGLLTGRIGSIDRFTIYETPQGFSAS